MKNNIDTAFILAAGIGSRLYPLTKSVPKCLIDFNGQTILGCQIEALRKNGFKKVIIAIGGFAEKVEDYVLKYKNSDIEVITEYNPFYYCSNNLVSLWSLRNYFNDGFVLLNGDIIFDSTMIDQIVNFKADIALGCRPLKEFDDDDMKVKIVNDRVVAVSKELRSEDVNAESLGILKFSSACAAKLLNLLNQMVREKDYINAFYLQAISKMAGTETVAPCFLDGKWFEMDYQRDYEVLLKEISNIN